MRRCRVGKIVCRGVAAWARRAHDFAHTDQPRKRAFAHPTIQRRQVTQTGAATVRHARACSGHPASSGRQLQQIDSQPADHLYSVHGTRQGQSERFRNHRDELGCGQACLGHRECPL